MGLACAHRAEGNEERATLEFQVARLGFERVGAVDQAAEAARACGDAGRDDRSARERLPQARPAVGALASPMRTSFVAKVTTGRWCSRGIPYACGI